MSIRIRIGMIGVVVYLLIVFLLGQENEARAMLKARLETVASAGKITLEDTRLRRSFFDRVFRPAFEKAVSLIGTVLPLSGKAQAQLEEKLRKSGRNVSAREYLARQAMCGAALLGAELLLTDSVVKVAPSIRFMALLYTGVGYYVLAKFALGKQITERAELIENEMPEILDLLSVSVSAGLGFDQALQYVTERCSGPFSEELTVTQREIRLGRSRNEALKNLSDRCEIESLRTFVSAIVQADTMGIAIANVLQVQADNVRQTQKQRIEEKAAKLPVKILIPLVLCIFPVMFIILLGPAVPNVIEAFSNM